MKLAILITVIGLSWYSTARGECYMRSSTTIPKQLIQTQPVDIEQLVTPDESGRGYVCSARYRVQVKNSWQTLEGIGRAGTEERACALAVNVDRGYSLTEVKSETIKSDSQMVCSDLPDIQVHPVKIGDVIYQSEVDMHTIASERKDFWYKRTQCRMFVEKDMKNTNLWLYQGVICRIDTTPKSKWRVIDKY